VEILGLEEQLTVFPRQADAALDLVPDGSETRVTEQQGTGRGSQHDHLCDGLVTGGVRLILGEGPRTVKFPMPSRLSGAT
jgi:hypothetical protein